MSTKRESRAWGRALLAELAAVPIQLEWITRYQILQIHLGICKAIFSLVLKHVATNKVPNGKECQLHYLLRFVTFLIFFASRKTMVTGSNKNPVVCEQNQLPAEALQKILNASPLWGHLQLWSVQKKYKCPTRPEEREIKALIKKQDERKYIF